MCILDSLCIPNWIIIFLVLGFLFYYFGTKNYNYFAKRNVPFIKPSCIPFMGNTLPILLRKLSIREYLIYLYKELDGHAFGGWFSFNDPIIIVRDPELIKAVMIKDFEHFTDHFTIVSEDVDPLWGKGLFNLQGEKWRDMRHTLSPAFTSSKMKTMFHLVEENGRQFIDFLEKRCKDFHLDKDLKIEKEGDMLVVEVRDLFTRFTNDVIASVAFGVSVDSFTKPSNDFFKLGMEAVSFGGIKALTWFGYMLFPKLLRMLNVNLQPHRVANFFQSLVNTTICAREREGIVRPDLINILMQARKGAVEDENSSNTLKKVSSWIKDEDLAAQAFFFFLGGFDATAVLLYFSTYHLAVHEHVQKRLQEEIDTMLESNKGHITYEGIHNMKYMDMVVSETLRLHTTVGPVDRKCVKPYTLPSDPPYEMKVGDKLIISVPGLHEDPKYFPEPDRFDPERFNDENKSNINPFTFLPFGTGPRNCIGMRLALMEGKIALTYLLHRFNLKVISRTPIPLKYTKKSFTLTADGGIWVGIEPRKLN